jgi:hypothetical protein
VRRDDFVDFFLVAPQHEAVDERLRAWAAWVRVRPHGWHVQPMFRHYRPEGWEARESRRAPRVAVNVPEAVEMEKAVSQLPEKHREAIRWCYFWSSMSSLEAKANGREHGPAGMSRRLGVSKGGLLELIQTARTMLRNRI